MQYEISFRKKLCEGKYAIQLEMRQFLKNNKHKVNGPIGPIAKKHLRSLYIIIKQGTFQKHLCPHGTKLRFIFSVAAKPV